MKALSTKNALLIVAALTLLRSGLHWYWSYEYRPVQEEVLLGNQTITLELIPIGKHKYAEVQMNDGELIMYHVDQKNRVQVRIEKKRDGRSVHTHFEYEQDGWREIIVIFHPKRYETRIFRKHPY